MSDRPKPKSNAILKNLPEERQEQIAEWCAKPNDRDEEGNIIPKSGGLAFAQAQLAADGLRVSLETLSRFFSWWQLQLDLKMSFDVEDQVLAATGNAAEARNAAESLLLRLGIARQDPELITAGTMAIDSRRSLDLMEESGRTKAAQKERSLAQKDEDLKIARAKFQRDTCELFLTWFEDKRAKEIVSSNGNHADKIAALGRAMFGEEWDQ